MPRTVPGHRKVHRSHEKLNHGFIVTTTQPTLFLGAVVLFGAIRVGIAQEPNTCPNMHQAWAGNVGPGISALDATVDAMGNFLVAGCFRETVDLDPTEGIDEHTWQGNNDDGYVTKILSDGTYAGYRTLIAALPERRSLHPGVA